MQILRCCIKMLSNDNFLKSLHLSKKKTTMSHTPINIRNMYVGCEYGVTPKIG